MQEYTITYDEKVKGWTSFHSFIPDWMCRLNNRFFTIKNGQIYVHNNEDSSVRNEFYGVQYPSKIDFIFNDMPENVKSYKTINIEGNRPWNVSLTTNLTVGNIDNLEFINKEDEWYSHIRRSEDNSDTSSLATQGLGTLQSISGNTISLNNNISPTFSIGDSLYLFNSIDSTLELIGVSESANYNNNEITVSVLENTPSNGDFIVSVKNSRIESSTLRGYYMLVEMTYEGSDMVELFAVNSEIFKSFE